VILLEGKQVLPAFVLGGGLVTAGPIVSWPSGWPRNWSDCAPIIFCCAAVVPTQIELRVILAAAIKLLRPEFDLPDTDPVAVRKYVSFLHKVLPPSAVDINERGGGTVGGPIPLSIDLAHGSGIGHQLSTAAFMISTALAATPCAGTKRTCVRQPDPCRQVELGPQQLDRRSQMTRSSICVGYHLGHNRK